MKHICTHERYRKADFEVFQLLNKEDQAKVRYIVSTISTAKFVTLDGSYHDVVSVVGDVNYKLKLIEKPDTKGWYEEIHALVRKHRLPRNYRATT